MASTLIQKKPSNSSTDVLRSWQNLPWWRHLWPTKNERYRTVDDFKVILKLGQGTYGAVYKARDRWNNKIVAMKKFHPVEENLVELVEKDQRSEIKFLRLCRHPSVVELKEVVFGEDCKSPVMIMEYAGRDLRTALHMYHGWLQEEDVKFLMHRLLQGVKCLHDNRIIHRDLKTSNILVDKKLRSLKIGDFGLACRRKKGTLKVFNDREVVSLWYRAPELLLGATHYTAMIDMWSVGCIMEELLMKRVLFKGGSEEKMLRKIINMRGAMNKKTWPGVEALPKYSEVRGMGETVKWPCARMLKKMQPLTNVSMLGMNLLKGLLTYDPRKRFTVDEALCHSWFRNLAQ